MSKLNVPEAEERARKCIRSEMDTLSDHDFLALADLAGRLAKQLHGEAVATGEAYSGTKEVLAEARAAGLLPKEESR